ncbi:MAG: hydrogenase maturation protease [Acidobacteriia bacterium]|nr:hydrogenase maturation protease [Terriglobia bacterium]
MRRVLIVACGNPLRGDDAAGWRIAEALEARLPAAENEVVTCRQLTPELAERMSRAETVLFVDASATAAPGSVSLEPVAAARAAAATLTHHLEPAALLGLTRLLYGRAPRRAFALLIGGQSFSLAEELSEPVRRALPEALGKIEAFVTQRTAESRAVRI